MLSRLIENVAKSSRVLPAKRRPSQKSRRKVRGRFQKLESRAMLTAVLFDDATGELEIEGTDAPDYVVIEQVAGQTVVTEWGDNDQPLETHSFSNVSEISVDAGDGNDVIANLTSIPMTASGGDGDDLIIGGMGNDVLESGPSASVSQLVDPAAANLLLIEANSLDQVSTIAAMDWPGDILVGRAGEDQLIGGGGTQIMFGGDGNDLLSGGNDSDFLLGQGENDDLIGGDGNDLLVGGGGGDLLEGGQGDDALYGDDAADNATIVQLLGNTSGTNWHGSNGGIRLEGFDAYRDPSTHWPVNFIDQAFLDAMWPEYEGYLFSEEQLDVEWMQETFADFVVSAVELADYLEALDGVPPAGDVVLPQLPNSMSGWAAIRIDDVLLGGSGNDFLQDGSGNDFLNGETGADTLVSGEGKDFLVGGSNLEWLTTGEPPTSPEGLLQFAEAQHGADVLIASADGTDDWLFGGTGRDIVMAGDRRDVARGGQGDDVLGPYASHHEGVRLSGDAGNDWLIGSAYDDALYGGIGEDTFYSGEGADYLDGFAAFIESEQRLLLEKDLWMDAAEVAGSEDRAQFVNAPVEVELIGSTLSITGSMVSDSIFMMQDELGNLVVRQSVSSGFPSAAGEIDERVWNSVFQEWTFDGVELIVVDARDGHDWVLNQTNLPSQMYGGEGSDKLIGGSADDLIEAGEGDDHLHGRDGTDRLSGQAGDDYLYGGANPFILEVSGDALPEDAMQWMEILEGGSGDDHLYGGSGSDLIGGMDGKDYLDGGQDADVLFVDSLLGGGIQSDLDGYDSPYLNMALGGDGDDWIYGGYYADRLQGGPGNDRLFGRSGDDWLRGDGGTDVVHGDAGNDLISAGASDGTETGNDLLFGGDGHDELDSDHGAVEMDGGAGDDWLFMHPSVIAVGGEGLDYGTRPMEDENELTEAVDQLIAEGEDPYALWREHRDAEFTGPGGMLIAMTTTLQGSESQQEADKESTTDPKTVESKTTSKIRVSVRSGVLAVQLNDAGHSIRFVEHEKGISLQRLDLKGNVFDTSIYRGIKSLAVVGGAGEDVIRNETSLPSTIQGGKGNDQLFGGSNRDKIFGDAGNDFLSGGKDAVEDFLSGGEGKDQFVSWIVPQKEKAKLIAIDALDDYFAKEDYLKTRQL